MRCLGGVWSVRHAFPQIKETANTPIRALGLAGGALTAPGASHYNSVADDGAAGTGQSLSEAVAGALLGGGIGVGCVAEGWGGGVDGQAGSGDSIGTVEGDVGLEEEDGAHAPVGEEGVTVCAPDDIHGLAEGHVFIARDVALVAVCV